MVPRIGLVHGRRRDARAAVAFEPLLDLRLRRVVRRVGHEEVAGQRIAERGRPVVRRDREDRPLERRRRLDRAALARRERDQTGVAEERAGPLGPLLVFGAHRGGRRRVDLVQLGQQADPVVGVGDLAGQPPELGREEVVLLSPSLAQRSRVVGQQLLLREHRAVEGLADRVVAARGVPLALEEAGEGVERIAGLGPDRRELLAPGWILHLLRHQLAGVLGRGAGLPDRAIDVDAWDDREVEVVHSLAQRPRHLGEACPRGLGELPLRAQAVEEQREHTLKAWIQVGRRLPLPDPPRRRELAAPEDRGREVAVDALRGREGLVREGPEALQPLAGPLVVAPEGVSREVVEPFVVGGEAKAARQDRRLREFLRDEGLDQLRERRHRRLP